MHNSTDINKPRGNYERKNQIPDVWVLTSHLFVYRLRPDHTRRLHHERHKYTLGISLALSVSRSIRGNDFWSRQHWHNKLGNKPWPHKKQSKSSAARMVFFWKICIRLCRCAGGSTPTKKNEGSKQPAKCCVKNIRLEPKGTSRNAPLFGGYCGNYPIN